jgi:hypothetical protein
MLALVEAEVRRVVYTTLAGLVEIAEARLQAACYLRSRKSPGRYRGFLPSAYEVISTWQPPPKGR